MKGKLRDLILVHMELCGWVESEVVGTRVRFQNVGILDSYSFI